uniref:Uncharacterized protein n=2 Tax=Clytia hemisphaerica TaxID=252671 RepID=A0A7M5X469_9CNID
QKKNKEEKELKLKPTKNNNMKSIIVYAILFCLAASTLAMKNRNKKNKINKNQQEDDDKEFEDVLGLQDPGFHCPDSLCNGRADGNYEYAGNSSYFVTCTGGQVDCQACWPLSLVFKEECNQCLYSKSDECLTTQEWEPVPQFDCPDMCGKMGPSFDGNMADPVQQRHYVACWHGVTVGCIMCPSDLIYNEEHNACLYEGKYFTQPDPNSS